MKTATDLEHATNAALAIAKLHKGDFPEAINWADLHACDERQDAEGQWHVWIEEADPGAEKLRKFVEKCLANDGFGAVTVTTEW